MLDGEDTNKRKKMQYEGLDKIPLVYLGQVSDTETYKSIRTTMFNLLHNNYFFTFNMYSKNLILR